MAAINKGMRRKSEELWRGKGKRRVPRPAGSHSGGRSRLLANHATLSGQKWN